MAAAPEEAMTRMTDERLMNLCEQEPGLDAEDAEEVFSELKRARSEEARLLRKGTEKDAEIAALRQQVATLIAGQQSAGEARQQAFYELASDLATMTPEGRDSYIRRIIDQRDNS
jgi:hypothetical protein